MHVQAFSVRSLERETLLHSAGRSGERRRRARGEPPAVRDGGGERVRARVTSRLQAARSLARKAHKGHSGTRRSAYGTSVFINCPFDTEYGALLDAIVFTVHDCGFVARCALEIRDTSEIRLNRIIALIRSSRFGIHDISRTELDSINKLPRFNMPLELGIFLGAKSFGGGVHSSKVCLVLDTEPYRYQKFCSDIAGQDPSAHNGDPAHPRRRTSRLPLSTLGSASEPYFARASSSRDGSAVTSYVPASYRSRGGADQHQHPSSA